VDDHHEKQLAQNEDLFREINEKIDALASSQGHDLHRYQFFCECSDLNCVDRVSLTLQEYAFARADPTRFVVAKEHAVDEIEHVVEEARDHVFVEKNGAAGRAAVELDT
jgi:hypothetical protein